MQQAMHNMSAREFRKLAGNRQGRKKMKRAEWVQMALAKAVGMRNAKG